MYRKLHWAINQGILASCHDLSDGGLGVALAESAFSGGLGATISLAALPQDPPLLQDDIALFSESPGRFLVSVHEKDAPAFETALSGFPYARVGQVDETPRLRVNGLQEKLVIDADIWELKKAWQKPLGV